MKISRKLLIPTFIFFAVVLLALIGLGTFDARGYLQDQEDNTLQGLARIFQNRLASLENFAVALATEVAANPEVQQAFAEGDRERLIELTLPAYEALDARFDIPQHQFHLPPATSFLRVHQLDRFGDDLSPFRFTVLEANNTRQPVSGLEVGRAGAGIRGVVPVSYQGNHVGTVEFGLNVDETLLRQLKQGIGSDWQIYLKRDLLDIATFETGQAQPGPTPDLVLQASTLDTPVFAEAEAYSRALGGQPFISRISADDRDYAVISAPIYDYSGQIVGVAEAVSDRTEVLAGQTRSLTIALVASLAALLLGGIGLVTITTRVLRPVGQLTEAATAIAEGDLRRTVPVIHSNDELETLSTAFNQMTDQLRGLVGQLENRVAERTRRLEIVAQLGERISGILQLDTLLSESVNQIKDDFGYYHAHIYRLDNAGEKLVVVAGTGQAGAEMMARGHHIALNAPTSLVARAARSQRVVRVDDVQTAPDWLPNPLLPDTRSEMAVPIVLENKVVGVLDVQSDVVAGLDEGDAALLRSVANQVAIAINNVELFARVEKALAEAEAVQAQYLQRAWSRDQVTRKSAGRVQFSLGESTTLGEESIRRARQAAEAEQSLTILPAAGEASATPDAPAETTVVAPLSLRGVTLGSLQLHGIEPGKSFTDSELALINAVADQVVQAAETLRLLNETQERASRERLVGQISDRLRRAPDFESLMKIGVEEIANALGPARAFMKLGPQADLLPQPPETDEAPAPGPAQFVTNSQPAANGRGETHE
ncbi:MAG: hypothetical protein Kow0031_31700 [Anaerolineae bacterium]